MKRALFTLALLALSASAFVPGNAATPKLSPKPAAGAETAFVTAIQQDLQARFATPADAEKAGYFRYTNEDKTGAISYANLQWNSTDPQHPSQLWYDVNGNLLGADFSVPITSTNATTAPNLWGVNPARWEKFPRPLVHSILKNADGTLKYGMATRGTAFTGAGGDLTDPQAATVVKLGLAKTDADVAKVFTFPALWDLTVWVKPNPNGAFAEANPLVKPSANAAKDSM